MTTTLETERPVKAPIDPRLRQRRIDVQREQARRRLRRLEVLGLIVLAVLFGALAAVSPLLDVDLRRVEGAQLTSPDAIRSASGITRGDPMLTLDLGDATRRIEALPWIDHARIRRLFPGTIDISVTERTPAAIVRPAKSPPFLIDAAGRRLGVVRAGDEVLPVIKAKGPVPAEGQIVSADLADALVLAQQATEQLTGHRVVVVHEPDRPAGLKVDGMPVRLGGPEERTQALLSLVTVLDRVDLACVTIIDLRAPERPVLTRDEPCQ